MKKWNLIIDVDKCNNCNNCAMAVKDEYIGNDFPGYSAAQPEKGHDWIAIDRHVRGNGSMVDVTYVPRMCNHCDDAPCVKAGGGAVKKRKDGIVIIDPVKARGREDLVTACPYRAVYWNEELQLPQHWTFDAHLLDQGWEQPRCVQSCATGAMTVAKMTDDEIKTIAGQQNLTRMHHELRPRVYYRGLEKTTTGFIGGNVCARDADGLLNNVENATVELRLVGEAESRLMTTDAYGDFKFDGIPTDGTDYTVRVTHGSFGTTEVTDTQARYLGTIELTR